MSMEEWFVVYSHSTIAWRKLLYRNEEDSRIQCRGFSCAQGTAIIQAISKQDRNYPTLLQILLRRARVTSRAAARMNCVETTAEILRYNGVLHPDVDTVRWTPDSFRCNVLDKHLICGSAYFREQIIIT